MGNIDDLGKLEQRPVQLKSPMDGLLLIESHFDLYNNRLCLLTIEIFQADANKSFNVSTSNLSATSKMLHKHTHDCILTYAP